jgi:hypothetical protein
MDLKEVGWGSMDRTDLAQDNDMWQVLVNAVMNLRAPQNDGNFLTSYGPVSFSVRALFRGGKMTLRHLHKLYETECASNINVEDQSVSFGRSRLWHI